MSPKAISTPIPNFTESEKPTPTRDCNFIKFKKIFRIRSKNANPATATPQRGLLLYC